MLLINPLKQYLRPLRYAQRRWQAEHLAHKPSREDNAACPPIGHIVGCGRSGTTILGKIMQHHPDVWYLFEPYHLWAAVDCRTDAMNLYYAVDGRMIADSDLASDGARLRYRRTIANAARREHRSYVIEKTPHNAMRIGFLEAVGGLARYAHIVRNGVLVAASISRIAGENRYKIATRPSLNQWWGENDVKWTTLCRDARQRGYFVDEIDSLHSDLQRGAFEWIVSILEIDRHRSMLRERLHEVLYDDLVEHTAKTLQDLASFFALPYPPEWISKAESMIGQSRTNRSSQLLLPPRMTKAFNDFQARFSFADRASELASDKP